MFIPYIVVAVAMFWTCHACPKIMSFKETKTLAFYHAKLNTPCNETFLNPQLTVTKRYGYQRHLSPIMCTNLNFGAPDEPRWECKSKYTLPEGYYMRDLKLDCEHPTDSDFDDIDETYYHGSCTLSLKVSKESDEIGWASSIASWAIYYMFIFVVWLIIISSDKGNGSRTSSGCGDGVCIINNGGGGRGFGGSSAFI